MSAEVVKKRGRPKKVITDPVEVEMPDIQKKSATRAKSTKAVPKATKTTTSTPTKTTQPKKPVSKPIGSSAMPKTPPQPSEPPKVVKMAGSDQSALGKSSPPTKPPVKTEPQTSKILDQVRELEAKKSSPQPSQLSIPPKPASKPVPPPKSPTVPPPKTPAANSKLSAPSKIPISKPLPSTKPAAPPPPPPSKPASKPHIPIAALNSEIVSNISARAGARPNAGGSQELPKGYKSAARKVTMTIVALPILIGTSYILYQRLVMGEERKRLVPVLPSDPPIGDAKVEPPSVTLTSS